MSLQSAVQHISSSLAAMLSSQLLTTGPDKHLVGMDRIAFGSIALAALVPILMWRIQRFVDRQPAVALPAPMPAMEH